MTSPPIHDQQRAAPASPLRILIVRVGAMGDVLHAMPAVTLLRQWLPTVEIGWAIEPRWSALLQADPSAAPGSAAMPLVDRLHLVPARQWSAQPFSAGTVRSILELRRDLRSRRYDLAIDLQGSIRSAVVARMSGPKLVIGSDTPRECPARWLYHGSATHTRLHVIEQAAEIVQAAIAGSADEQPSLPTDLPAALLPHDPEAELWASNLLHGISAPVVLLAPSAGWGAKQWPAESFGNLACDLAARGCHVLVNASPPLPDGIADQVLAAVGSPANRVRAAGEAPTSAHIETREAVVRPVAASLPQLIALLRRVALVVAGDTGPLHLATGLRRPVVALFGPTDPARNGPFGTESRVLRHPSSTTDHRRHAATEAGLACISVDEVLSAALDLLGL